MSHDHHDHRSLGITSLNKAFVIGIVLNAGFVVAEFIAGFWYNSLGLISDAGHNLEMCSVWYWPCWLFVWLK